MIGSALGLAAFLLAAPPAAAQQHRGTHRDSAPRAPASSPSPPAPQAPALAPLPEPPIPVQHAAQAGMGACVPVVDRIARESLATPYNAQSGWNAADPAHHVFQSVAGVRNPRNTPPDGLLAIIAAPVAPDACDGVSVEVYPVAGSCADVQKLVLEGGEAPAMLEGVRVVNDARKRRLFLLPGYANTCVAVSVTSSFSAR